MALRNSKKQADELNPKAAKQQAEKDAAAKRQAQIRQAQQQAAKRKEAKREAEIKQAELEKAALKDAKQRYENVLNHSTLNQEKDSLQKMAENRHPIFSRVPEWAQLNQYNRRIFEIRNAQSGVPDRGRNKPLVSPHGFAFIPKSFQYQQMINQRKSTPVAQRPMGHFAHKPAAAAKASFVKKG